MHVSAEDLDGVAYMVQEALVRDGNALFLDALHEAEDAVQKNWSSTG